MKQTNKFEEQIPYIVRLKENFIMPNTTIMRTFCGFLVNNVVVDIIRESLKKEIG